MYDEYFVSDPDKLQQIEDALRHTYFRSYDQDFLATDHGREDIRANVFKRYDAALRHVVPWVARQIDLGNKTLVEIGCGTGSSTAAFSHFVKEIHGYDVDPPSIDGARARLEILGITNATLHLIAPEQLAYHLQQNHADGVDIILLYAVLEHQTIRERHETLTLCWRLLNEQGLLVVVESPNLLLYFDHHTTLLPFMHLLPTELYARYAPFSPREGFNQCFNQTESMSLEDKELKISRWGRGISFHDFQLSLGPDYGKYLVSSGFEQEMLSWFDVSPEEELLRLYAQSSHLDIPLGFTRSVLSLIFKKRPTPSGMTEVAPENRFFFPIDLVWRQQGEINALTSRLEERDAVLGAIQGSLRWRISTWLTEPYRLLKRVFCRR